MEKRLKEQIVIGLWLFARPKLASRVSTPKRENAAATTVVTAETATGSSGCSYDNAVEISDAPQNDITYLDRVEQLNTGLGLASVGLALTPNPYSSAVGIGGLALSGYGGLLINFAKFTTGQISGKQFAARFGLFAVTEGAGQMIARSYGKFSFNAGRFYAGGRIGALPTLPGLAGQQATGLLEAGAMYFETATQDVSTVPLSVPNQYYIQQRQ